MRLYVLKFKYNIVILYAVNLLFRYKIAMEHDNLVFA